MVEGTHLALRNRANTKALSRPMTDQIQRLSEGLKEEGSKTGHKMIYIHINRWINLALNKPTPKGGKDHDTIPIAEEAMIGQIRFDLHTLICDNLDLGMTAYKTKVTVREYLKSDSVISITLDNYLRKAGYS